MYYIMCYVSIMDIIRVRVGVRVSVIVRIRMGVWVSVIVIAIAIRVSRGGILGLV